MAPATDPYRALGVRRDATEAQIKAAHRTLAKRYHPDARTGDSVRFLLIQEAYKLLTDPLRRREWDARHAPGPVRAGQPGVTRPRQSDRPPAGVQPAARRDPAAAREPAAGRDPGSGRDPASRRYTWSASEVPWWEEGGQAANRRQPGRRRPSGKSDASGSTAETGRRARVKAPETEARQDFEVYNRSSGAAWSMAARAYFRRGDEDLPRRGSFRQQGTQPLTAARARVAAEEEARRSPAAPSAAPPPRAGTARAQPARPASQTRPPSQSRPASSTSRAQAFGPTAAPRRAGWAGVARDPGAVAQARRDASQRARATAWPSFGQRLGFALIAWIPFALVIGYGGAVATGCDRAAVSCPRYLEPAQAILIALALALLVALPRVAYVAALATLGLLGAALVIVAGAWFFGLRAPLPAPVLAVSSAVLLVIYLATASWIVAGGPRRRPWSA